MGSPSGRIVLKANFGTELRLEACGGRISCSVVLSPHRPEQTIPLATCTELLTTESERALMKCQDHKMAKC